MGSGHGVSRHFLLGQKLFDIHYSDICYYAKLLLRHCLFDISSFWQRLLWHLGLDLQNLSLWPMLLGHCYLNLLLFSHCLLTHFATETFATFIPCDICYYDKSSFFNLTVAPCFILHILKSNNKQEQSSSPHRHWVQHQRPVIPAM